MCKHTNFQTEDNYTTTWPKQSHSLFGLWNLLSSNSLHASRKKTGRKIQLSQHHHPFSSLETNTKTTTTTNPRLATRSGKAKANSGPGRVKVKVREAEGKSCPNFVGVSKSRLNIFPAKINRWIQLECFRFSSPKSKLPGTKQHLQNLLWHVFCVFPLGFVAMFYAAFCLVVSPKRLKLAI